LTRGVGGIYSAVAVARPSQDSPASRPATLGDVLYASTAKAPVSEASWVALVRAIAEGDQPALHTLYTQAHRIVFTLIMRITGNRETAEELTLDVFHDVWRRASTYDPAGGSVVGWIMNQARSRAIDRVRFDHRKKRVNTEADDPLPAAMPRGPQEAFDAGEQGRLLRSALQTLTPDERQAIETAFFSELTYDEVATRLNQPLGTVKTRIRSGLSKLRRVLAETRQDP
jgi:RNA polymerase sigma-70 factor (ECF subfamily)